MPEELLVLLDSNVFVSDFHWRSARFQLLLAEARRGHLRIVVPRLVVQEVANKYAERVTTALGDARRARRDLERLGHDVAWDVKATERAEIRKTFEEDLVHRLGNAGASMPDYPTIEHEAVVARLLEGKKPFTSEGKGYRDALLWNTVVQVAKIGRVSFVSNNYKDFASSKEGNVLHEHLRADLSDNGIDPTRVELLPDLDAFVRSHVEPARAVQAEVASLLRSDEEFRLHVDEQLAAAINAQLPAGSVIEVDEEIYNPFDEITIANLETESLQNISVDDARLGDSEDVYLFLSLDVEASLDAFIEKFVLYGLDDPSVMVLDWDWNDHYSFVALSGDASISLEARFDPSSRTVDDVGVLNARIQSL
jgi:predicted nucleic acid-binding protein